MEIIALLAIVAAPWMSSHAQTVWKKLLCSALAKQLLDVRAPIYAEDNRERANLIVTAFMQSKQKPIAGVEKRHKVAITAASFASAIDRNRKMDLGSKVTFVASIGSILQKVEADIHEFNFSKEDEQLIKYSSVIYFREARNLANSPLASEIWNSPYFASHRRSA